MLLITKTCADCLVDASSHTSQDSTKLCGAHCRLSTCSGSCQLPSAAHPSFDPGAEAVSRWLLAFNSITNRFGLRAWASTAADAATRCRVPIPLSGWRSWQPLQVNAQSSSWTSPSSSSPMILRWKTIKYEQFVLKTGLGNMLSLTCEIGAQTIAAGRYAAVQHGLRRTVAKQKGKSKGSHDEE